jgi:hypothetical protein
MPDLKALLRKLADEYEAEEERERSSAREERIDKLEAELRKAMRRTPEAVDDAVEELSDEEWKLIEQHRKGAAAPPPAVEEPTEEEPPRRTRLGRKSGQAYMWTVDDDGNVQKVDIAHVYSGADEPDEVTLPDEVIEEEPAA